MLDHLTWILRRTGISSEALSAEFSKSITRHQHLKSLRVPPPEVLEYTRILTRWVTDPAFVDEHGNPRTLPFKGRGGSFTSLVRLAVPEATASDVLASLERCGVIQRTLEGRVEAISTNFFPNKGKNDAHVLGYALHAIEAMLASARANLSSQNPGVEWCQFLRMASSERFD